MQYAYVAAAFSWILFHYLIHLEEQKIHKLFLRVQGGKSDIGTARKAHNVDKYFPLIPILMRCAMYAILMIFFLITHACKSNILKVVDIFN